MKKQACLIKRLQCRRPGRRFDTSQSEAMIPGCLGLKNKKERKTDSPSEREAENCKDKQKEKG